MSLSITRTQLTKLFTIKIDLRNGYKNNNLYLSPTKCKNMTLIWKRKVLLWNFLEFSDLLDKLSANRRRQYQWLCVFSLFERDKELNDYQYHLVLIEDNYPNQMCTIDYHLN